MAESLTNNQINAIVQFVKTYHKTDAKIHAINKQARKVYGDFYPEYPLMPEDLEVAINGLLDSFLGDTDLAGYILYERGEIVEKDTGNSYDMADYKDIKKYLKICFGQVAKTPQV